MGNSAYGYGFQKGKKAAEVDAKIAAEKVAKNENIKKGVVAVAAAIGGALLRGLLKK